MKHHGNQVFADVIDSYKEAYEYLGTKQAKMKMTREIVMEMKTVYKARFIRLEGRKWIEIPESLARDKVSHALRFALKKAQKTSKSLVSSGFVGKIASSAPKPCHKVETEPQQWVSIFPEKIDQFDNAPLLSLNVDYQTFSFRSIDDIMDPNDPFDTMRSDDLNAVLGGDVLTGSEYTLALTLAAGV